MFGNSKTPNSKVPTGAPVNPGTNVGITAPPTPGSSTPTTDLDPTLPSFSANHYTPDQKYGVKVLDSPFAKRAKRWFQVVDIGVITRIGGSNSMSVASPLTIAAGKQTYEFQDPPEKVIVGIMANNTANAELDIWIGDGGGFPIRIGNGGKATIPLEGESRITFQAIAQSIKGTIIAVSGYNDDELDYIPASQP